MKIAVLGHHGMLGKEVVKQLREAGDVVVLPTHRIEDTYPPAYVWKHEVECVINCAGKRPGANAAEMVAANALGPHVLASQYKGRIIHVSTDCVFSGSMRRAGYHALGDLPDPINTYGRSKLCGEVDLPHVTNVRTSFIGFDHGLLKWLIASRLREVEGYRNAMWTGSTVYEVARCLINYYIHSEPIGGISHLATTEAISKYDLLHLLNKELDLGVKVKGVNEPWINRALLPTWPLKFNSDILKELRSEYFSSNPSGSPRQPQEMAV